MRPLLSSDGRAFIERAAAWAAMVMVMMVRSPEATASPAAERRSSWKSTWRTTSSETTRDWTAKSWVRLWLAAVHANSTAIHNHAADLEPIDIGHKAVANPKHVVCDFDPVK